jgi:hypothetical protein
MRATDDTVADGRGHAKRRKHRTEATEVTENELVGLADDRGNNPSSPF